SAVEIEASLTAAMRGELPHVQKQLLAKVQANDTEAALILETLVAAYLATQQLPPALECVTRLVALEPDNPQAWYWRGLTREQLMFVRLAIADYEKSMAL